MVNPAAFVHFHGQRRLDKNFFGYANTVCSVIAGPYADEPFWALAFAGILAHEMGHVLSTQQVFQCDSVFINDYYTREKLADVISEQDQAETALLKQNCLSEYFLEDPKNPGTPLPSASLCITKAIEKTKPKWHDTGLTFFNEETGVTHRILTPHDGKALMSGSFPDDVGNNELPPATKFHKALLEIGAELYLARSERKENPELLREHDAFKERQKSDQFSTVERSEGLQEQYLLNISNSQALPLTNNWAKNMMFTYERNGVSYRG